MNDDKEIDAAALIAGFMYKNEISSKEINSAIEAFIESDEISKLMPEDELINNIINNKGNEVIEEVADLKGQFVHMNRSYSDSVDQEILDEIKKQRLKALEEYKDLEDSEEDEES